MECNGAINHFKVVGIWGANPVTSHYEGVYMHAIADLVNESGLSIDDIRLILMDVRSDWESCETVTAAERELILNASRAKLIGESSITPVDPGRMPIQDQQKIVQSASQVLGTRLVLALAEEIAILDAIEEAKNRVIIANHQNRQRELTQALGSSWRDRKVQHLDTLRSLVNHLNPKVEVEPDNIDAIAEIAKIHQEMGKLLSN